jgi:hypothetical protein
MRLDGIVPCGTGPDGTGPDGTGPDGTGPSGSPGWTRCNHSAQKRGYAKVPYRSPG